ncbi:hypothetical protein IL306_001876 [Fusarium sp. DS 682]|nr:hypothetical protein IL306_001876 [Fusarium sp. DS 682]
MSIIFNNVLISAHCTHYNQPLKWYEEQVALKEHALSEHLRSELPIDEKTGLKHNDLESLDADRCKSQGKPFRFLAEPDVIEPDDTNSLIRAYADLSLVPERNCDRPRVSRQVRLRGADGLVIDDDGHGGKLAFLVCLYKRLYTKVELSLLIDMSKEQSLVELLMFFCHAIIEKLEHPKCLPSDPTMLTRSITEITKLYNNSYKPLRFVDQVSVRRKKPRQVLQCLCDQFPRDLGSINLQSITYKQFAIVVGFYIEQTIWAPSPKAGAWNLLGIATNIANGAYPPRVSLLLDELDLDAAAREQDQLEEEVASLSLLSKDISNGPAEDQSLKSQCVMERPDPEGLSPCEPKSPSIADSWEFLEIFTD